MNDMTEQTPQGAASDNQAPIQFMKLRILSTIFSICLIVGSIVSLFAQQLNFGLDFTGGTLLEVKYETAPSLSDIRSKLDSSGYKNAVVQYFGTDTDIIVRLPQLNHAAKGSPKFENHIADIESGGV